MEVGASAPACGTKVRAAWAWGGARDRAARAVGLKQHRNFQTERKRDVGTSGPGSYSF